MSRLDPWASGLYAAEQVAFPRMHGRNDLTIAECQRITNRLLAAGWFAQPFKQTARTVSRVEVVKSRGMRSSRGGLGSRGWAVWLSPACGHLNAWILAHELAHVADIARNSGGGHGPGFAAVYVSAVRAICGDVWADHLLDVFRTRLVPVDLTLARDVGLAAPIAPPAVDADGTVAAAATFAPVAGSQLAFF